MKSAAQWAVLAGALALLNASLTFENLWPTLWVRFTAALSIEVALFLLSIVVAVRWFKAPSPVALRVLAAIWVVLVIGRYEDVTARSLYGRDINLYWDLRNLPSVGGMLSSVAKPWLMAATISGIALVPLIYLPLRWALGCVANASKDPRVRHALTAVAAGVLVVGVAQGLGVTVPGNLRVVQPVTAVYARQARQFAYEISGAGLRALPPAPTMRSNLGLVKGADVLLLFLESYGAVSWDRPVLVDALAASRTRLDGDIRDTGRRVVSTLVESTTFGGKSWLAHISLLSGTDVRDEQTSVRLMSQRRETMVTAFSRHGYRTVAIMPGVRAAWPEGAFYGFDDIYDVARLDYQGPSFGWWNITDQFALARMDALEIAPRSRQPVFVFFPTISTHTPFTPAPPYQPDWSRILTRAPYDDEVLARAWAQEPDWFNLAPSYAQALDYAYLTLGGYLRLRADRDFVLVLVGDHQPPAMVSGEEATWDVPVHVITNRAGVIDRLLQQRFSEGLRPHGPSAIKMHALLPILLDAFDGE
ncbi:MAG TPA: sulfatase-like hydrolase/transferase [Vicinamibacterales bacterium]|nr:sulfatase-like hydrolase/transferase [Vicinamibacterales bacterium]